MRYELPDNTERKDGFLGYHTIDDALERLGCERSRGMAFKTDRKVSYYFKGKDMYEVTEDNMEIAQLPEESKEHRITIKRNGEPILISRDYQDGFVDYDDEDCLEQQNIVYDPMKEILIVGNDEFALKILDQIGGRIR